MNFCAIIVIVACITVAEPIEASKPDWQTFEATAYTAKCAGCTGITKTGIDVRETIYHEGKRIIAVDPRVIPLGSTVEIRLSDGTTFEALAADIGGAIKGARIDVLVADKKTAQAFGRQDVELRIITKGDEQMAQTTKTVVYREVKREAQVGEHIKIVAADCTFGKYENGDVFTVDKVDDYGVFVDAVKASGNPEGYICHREYIVLEPIETEITQEQIADIIARLGAAERRISELEARVSGDKTRGEIAGDALRSVLDRTAKTFSDLFLEPKLERDEIVERAKRDVAELLNRNYPGRSIWFTSENGMYSVTDECDFVVNREKRTVVALIKLKGTNLVHCKGKAKCAPGDVFNVHIGKAIALRRALGLPVPDEYLNAPQPTEVRAGDIVRLCDGRLYKCKYNWPKLTAGETFFDDTRDGYEYKTEVTAE